MEHIHGARELDGVHRAEGAPFLIFNDLQDAGTTEALERFGVHMLPTALGLEEGKPHRLPDLQREVFQVLLTGANPEQRLRLFAVNHDMPNLA